ncbi:MAG: 3-oxoacyl-[acyl-carrier-protein] synthase III C-terminal domain-containing protein [Chitinophagaceae bacterium]
MIHHKPVKIIGVGKYLPAEMSSMELENKYHIPNGWSEKYSGVLSRHQVSFETNGYMGGRAVEAALKNAGLKLSDMDMIISASASFDYPLPNSASVIKSELPDNLQIDIPAIDIDSSCLSFVSAFEYASNMLNGSQYKRIVIVSAEISSIAANPANWETLTLLGDGAAAVILAYDEASGSEFIRGGLRTYSEGVYDTIFKGGGNKYFYRDHLFDPDIYSFAMNGLKLLRLATKKLPEFMEWFFSGLPVNLTDINVIIPHQPSKTGLSLFKRLFLLKENQMKESISCYGNCIAASIPLTLVDAIEQGEIKRGDLCLLFGTSAGFSIGAVLIKY